MPIKGELVQTTTPDGLKQRADAIRKWVSSLVEEPTEKVPF